MQVNLSFDVSRGSPWAGLGADRDTDRDVEITASAQREWDRHPELHAQYRSFDRYLVACRQWTYA